MIEQTFYSFKLQYYQDNTLAEQLLPIARKFLSDPSKLTNEWNYKNTYTYQDGLAVEPDLKFFVDFILEKSYDYLKSQNIKLKPNIELWVSLFASEMHMGDEHDAHNHPGALLSGLIYLQCPIGSANLEFSSPRHSNKAWLNYLDESSYCNSNELFSIKPDHTIVVKPSPGLFLFWESWALHRVPPNQSIDGRITLVFNAGVDHARI